MIDAHRVYPLHEKQERSGQAQRHWNQGQILSSKMSRRAAKDSTKFRNPLRSKAN